MNDGSKEKKNKASKNVNRIFERANRASKKVNGARKTLAR
jgi:hypothetical protein